MRWLVSALVFLLTLPGWAAFTERYVTSAASGGGVGTEGDPWTVAEAASSGVAGDRINVQSDSGYTLGSTTLSSPGTAAALLVWRGYDTVIGDLEGLGRNADGTLVVTGFPVFTMSGSFVPSAFSIVQNISFTGAINSPIFGNTAVDNWKLVSCNVLNTNSGGSTYGVRGDNSATLINCDVECSGATSVATFNADATPLVFGCRLKGTGNLCSAAAIRVYNTVFIGDGSAKGVVVENNNGIEEVIGCTFYNLATAFQRPNSAPGKEILLINNHVTDSTKWLDNLYSGTGNVAVVEINSRTRDNTTPRTGIDGINISEVTTDTGGAETDYVDAGSDNLRLISGAPGEAAVA